MTDEYAEEQPEFDCSYTDECVCPHCGHKQRDAHEIGDGAEGDGEADCGSCGAMFAYSRYVSVRYSTEKLKLKAKP